MGVTGGNATNTRFAVSSSSAASPQDLDLLFPAVGPTPVDTAPVDTLNRDTNGAPSGSSRFESLLEELGRRRRSKSSKPRSASVSASLHGNAGQRSYRAPTVSSEQHVKESVAMKKKNFLKGRSLEPKKNQEILRLVQVIARK